MKQAYLIIAHNKFDMLRALVRQLDCQDNDIYIHLDKKAGDVDFSQFEGIAQHSRVECLRDRINVMWGGVSQISATCLLLKTALRGGQYGYFHLLSGVDFPLKSNQAISAFLEAHNGKEFIGFTDQHPDFKSKLERYNIIPPDLMRRSSFARLLNKFSKGVQYALGIYQYRDTSKFAKGCQWWSITDDLAQAILKDKESILKKYRFVSCSDEIFMQTFVKDHPEFMQRVFTTEGEFEGCLRLIDWNRGKPYEFWSTDVEEMIASGRLFARKIKDVETMDLLASKINKHQNL